MLLLALPLVKGTAYSLYPVAGVALLAVLWRHHRRSDAAGLGGPGARGSRGARALRALRKRPRALSGQHRRGSAAPAGALSEVLAHPLGYLAYLWEVFLPRLSFMAPHFETAGPAGVHDLRRTRVGRLRLVRRALPALGVRRDPRSPCSPSRCSASWPRAREWAFVRRNLPEAAILLLMPIAVVAGVEAAFYTTGVRPLDRRIRALRLPRDRPARGAGGRLAARLRTPLGAARRAAGCWSRMLALSYAAQLLTLTLASMPERRRSTVAIPVRDGGELLARTLRALARQTVAHELLVCDSGSTRRLGRAGARARGARARDRAGASSATAARATC